MLKVIQHSVSSLRLWDTCKKRYWYEYVRRIRPAYAGRARSVGTATHAGLEAFSLGADLDGVAAAAVAASSGPEWATPEGQIELARVRAMLAAYYVTWAQTRANWEAVEVEGKFRIGDRFIGKKDALKRRRLTGQLYLWERKTTSDEIDNVGTDFWRRLMLDRQLALYQLEIEERLGETPAVLYDVIKKPGGDPKLKKSITRRKDESDEQLQARKDAERETLAEFATRMMNTMLEEPGAFLVRREVHRTREQVDEVLAELEETAAEIDSYRGRYPRNDAACSARFGICPFLGVCTGVDSLDSEKFVSLPTTTSEDAHGSNISSTEYSAEELPF